MNAAAARFGHDAPSARLDLPKDPGVLKTAAQHNEVRVGVYTSLASEGTIRIGDSVRVL